MTLPIGHRWCGHCGGDGQAWNHDSDELDTCAVCKGKGYWNRDDIRDYHEMAPNVCEASCGPDGHIEPRWMPGEPHSCLICKSEFVEEAKYYEHFKKCLDYLDSITKDLLDD